MPYINPRVRLEIGGLQDMAISAMHAVGNQFDDIQRVVAEKLQGEIETFDFDAQIQYTVRTVLEGRINQIVSHMVTQAMEVARDVIYNEAKRAAQALLNDEAIKPSAVKDIMVNALKSIDLKSINKQWSVL